MELKIPKSLIDIIDSIGINDILLWLKEMIQFYIVPIRFYKKFYAKSTKLQISQTVFYTLLIAFLSWVLSDKMEFKNSYRFILGILLFTISLTFVNLVSIFIISRSKCDFWKIGSFIYLLWTILLIPALFFLTLYVSSENYIFYFLNNLMSAVAFFYSLFLIWHILFESITKIIFGYLLNITILNCLFFVFILSLFDSYSKDKSEDPIMSELNECFQNLKNLKPEGVPYTMVQETNLNSYTETFEISFINESVTYYTIDSLNILKIIASENVKYLDSIIPLLEFKRNKEILRDFLDYNKNVNKLFLDSTCDACITKDTLYKNLNGSLVMFDRQEIRISKFYTQPLKKFQKRLKDFSDINNIANSPSQITGFLLKPSILLAKLIGVKKDIQLIIKL